MKKKIFIVTFFIIINIFCFNNKLVFADTQGFYLIDENGYENDTHYAPSVSSALGDSVSYSISNNTKVGGKQDRVAIPKQTSIGIQYDYRYDVPGPTTGEPIIKIENRSQSNNAVALGDTINVKFYIIDDCSYADSAYNGTFKMDSCSNEYFEVRNNGDGCEHVKRGRYHIRYNLAIKLLKKIDRQIDLSLPIKTTSSSINYTIKIRFSKIIDADEVTQNNSFAGMGYIKDSNSGKLQAENDNHGGVIVHRFPTSGDLKNRAETFINSYAIKNEVSDLKKTDSENYSQTPNFTNYKDSNGQEYNNIKVAEVGFNFKTTSEKKVYNFGTTRIFKWTSKFCLGSKNVKSR